MKNNYFGLKKQFKIIKKQLGSDFKKEKKKKNLKILLNVF